MRPMDIAELSIVELEWVDSSHIQGWTYEKDYAFVPSKQHSVGWVVSNQLSGNTAALVISTTVGCERHTKAKFGGVHTPFSIPWCSIIKCKVIRKT